MYHKANPFACKQVNFSYHPPKFRFNKKNNMNFFFIYSFQTLPGLINKYQKELLQPQLTLIIIRDLLMLMKPWQFRAISPA